MDINKKNTIYYGTSIEYIKEIDKIGVRGPRVRDEQYISVTISGYKSEYELAHDDLVEFGRVYSEVLGIAEVVDNCLHFKEGYENTMTYVEGFGPNPSEYLRGFYGLISNNRTSETVTLVLRPEAINQLIVPDKKRKFEYLSLALHGFMSEICEKDIIAWIVPEKHYASINNMIKEGSMKPRKLISDKSIKPQKFDYNIIAKYGSYPSKIGFYSNNLEKDQYYRDTRLKHLKYILQDFNEINWETQDNELEITMANWVKSNHDAISWDSDQYKYIRDI